MSQFREEPCEHLKTIALFSNVSGWRVWSMAFLVCAVRWQGLLRTTVCNETEPSPGANEAVISKPVKTQESVH